MSKVRDKNALRQFLEFRGRFSTLDFGKIDVHLSSEFMEAWENILLIIYYRCNVMNLINIVITGLESYLKGVFTEFLNKKIILKAEYDIFLGKQKK